MTRARSAGRVMKYQASDVLGIMMDFVLSVIKRLIYQMRHTQTNWRTKNEIQRKARKHFRI
uniref:Uncharacterized protein n=1 Tax=uncultured marine virus TaxID=186617 RepID=A0A0F7L2X9_9VIRU|nr:hypothetical protein [uncultured marine virus]